MITEKCARCGAQKHLTDFECRQEVGILIRPDSCRPCCQEIAEIRGRVSAQQKAAWRQHQGR
jgi:hypothetical protein